MVLDPVNHSRLMLPMDAVYPPEEHEYKFLIRGHFNNRYICMNSEGRVHTVLKEDGKLPEDCLWRGLLIPSQQSDQLHKEVSFYQAFYPDVQDGSARIRWYLGFKPDETRAARGGSLRGGSKVRFQVVKYERRREEFPEEKLFENRPPPAAPGPAVQIGEQSVKMSNSTLTQAAMAHVSAKFAPQDCRNATSLIQLVMRDRQQRLAGVLSSLRQLRRALRLRSQRAGLSKEDQAAGEKALKGYLREVTYHFLYNRGRCVREELTVAFKSTAVADLIMSLPSRPSRSGRLCQQVRRRRAVRSHKRRFRRHQRELRKFFHDKLGARADFDGRRKPKVLDLFRSELNVSLPSMRTIQEARLWRRVKKRYESVLKQYNKAVNQLSKQLQSAYYKEKLEIFEAEDAAKFILTLKQKRTQGKLFKANNSDEASSSRRRRRLRRHGRRRRARQRTLVSRHHYHQLLQQYSNFPIFYFDMQCNRAG